MSLNQSRSEKNDSQYRKPGGGGGRSGSNSGAQHRPFNGGRGGRGAPGPTSGPPPNRSYKKVNNDQGGQSRPNPGFVNAADPRAASGGRSVENGGHAQPALQAVPRAPVPAPAPAPAAVAKQADSLPQKTSRPLPRPPPSQSASTNANSGDGPKGFSLQFGSISAGYLHAVQVPARTNSAPPNLDEQKRDQVLRDASRAVPAAPLPFSYRQDSSTKTDVSTEKSVSRETSTEPQAKRDDLVGVKYPPKQAPKPSPPPPKTGLSTLSQFHQPAPATLMQYGVPNPRVQSQGTPSTSLQMLTVGIGYPTAKVVDRSGVPARSDRRGNGIMEADRWNKQPGPFPPAQDPRMDFFHGNDALGFQGARGPSHGVLRTRPQFPVQHVGGILAGPMHSLGFQGGQRNNSDADRWQRGSNFNKGLIHKAERKYEVGKVTDEEQAKQRKLKGILNKLTPQNFERLFEQVKEVNIDNVTTLTGVIDQIFDKALTELTFCEMYADFCQHLASELPDLNVNNEKITFRRLLLNKCQEEFERGEREEQEANNADGEDGSEQSEAVREEKRVKARKRMLGNIRLIGELYKKRMLTERIMHECIKKLLGEYQNPDEENIEALCKLMSTIGEMIDHSKAKDHMDAYFDIMGQLSNNKMLSSRVRFMLRDAIDLRKNKWQERRKVEGPKKIEDVHRDAAQERQSQVTRLNRVASMNTGMRRGQPLDFGPRGSMLSSPMGPGMPFRGMPPQMRGFGGHDMRIDERNVMDNHTLSVPLPQRSSADVPIALRPQGSLARGMSYNGPPSVSSSSSYGHTQSFGNRRTTGSVSGHGIVPEHGVYSTREDHFMRSASDRYGAAVAYDQSSSQELNSSYKNVKPRYPDQSMDRSRPITSPATVAGISVPQNNSLEKSYTEERMREMREMSIAAIKEFYSVKDEKEVALCIKDLNAPNFYPNVVSIWVNDSFERKDIQRDLLAELLVSLTKPRDGTFSTSQLIQGFESVLAEFEDAVTDAPKAPEFLGRIFAKVILENVLPLKDVALLIHQGGFEPGSLREEGLAADVLGSLLETIKAEKGESTLKEIRASCNLQLEDFRPPPPKRSRKLEMFL